jgi:autotransporter-associated beta strand protein
VYLFGVNAANCDVLAGNASAWLLGAGGAGGPTTRSVVPWVGVYTSGGYTAPAGFATYDAATGFRALDPATEYATGITTGAAHNVSTDKVTLTQNAVVNSLRFTGGTGNIGSGRTLTVASGGVFFTGSGTLGGSGSATAGALDFGGAEGILSVHADNSATIGSQIRGTDGFSKIQTGTLTLTGANACGGPVHVGGGTLRVGDGSFASNLGSGDVDVHAGATLRISTSAAIADTATVRLYNVGPGMYFGRMELDSGRTETVKYLYLGDAGMPAGTYGGPGSGAGSVLPAHFVGAGVLTVTDSANTIERGTLITVW